MWCMQSAVYMRLEVRNRVKALHLAAGVVLAVAPIQVGAAAMIVRVYQLVHQRGVHLMLRAHVVVADHHLRMQDIKGYVSVRQGRLWKQVSRWMSSCTSEVPTLWRHLLWQNTTCMEDLSSYEMTLRKKMAAGQVVRTLQHALYCLPTSWNTGKAQDCSSCDNRADVWKRQI